MNVHLDDIEIDDIKDIAILAGNAVIDIYNNDFEISYKEDNSPLTEADLKANKIICDNLLEFYPHIPILSEENKEITYDIRQNWEYYWCIDPIDGTKEFINKNGEFTINIALICNNIPVLGVVYAPVFKDIYYAKKDNGAYKNNEKLPIIVNDDIRKKITVVASKSYLSKETQKYINNFDSKEIVQVFKGSSLKFCMVAEGIADVYPRLSPTMEWDTAASHAIILESGKEVIQYENLEPVSYNKENLVNPWFIVKNKD